MQGVDLEHCGTGKVDSSTGIPLVVDLDGTLLRSDILIETGLACMKRDILGCIGSVSLLRKGKAELKERLATESDIDVTLLPYNTAVLSVIAEERAKGRKIALATASHASIAMRIADHLGIFDQVFATSESNNLSAHRKRDLLIEQYGIKGFDYIGNSHDDLVVWDAAREAIVVEPECGVKRRALALGNVTRTLIDQDRWVKDWTRALRIHQWLKNILILVPLITAHRFNNAEVAGQALCAFILFGLCASSVYILNDLIDLSDDRRHKAKRFRPFAAGRIPLLHGLIVCPVLLIGAFAGAIILFPPEFFMTLLAYYGLTIAYSFSLKRHMAIDVIALAILYTMRIIAGALAFYLELTFWLLAFSMFMFLSLALVKRYAELRDARVGGRDGKTLGRGYYPSDLEMLAPMGAASGYLSVMVLAMYIHEPLTTELYAHPKIIWLACPLLLYWVTRIWMLTYRGMMHDDPVMFAVKDKISMMTGLAFALVFWIAA